MRKGIKVDFTDGGESGLAPSRLDFSKKSEGFEAIAQNAAINIITRRGSDRIVPEKGTFLFEAALLGSLLDPGQRAHSAGYAAELTRLLYRGVANDEGLTNQSPEKISDVSLETKTIDLKRIVFNARFVSVTGESVGVLLADIL